MSMARKVKRKPKFTKSESECIAREIRSAKKKGKPQKQRVAIAINKCAPKKSLRTLAKKGKKKR